jgi:Domain of unknown function (DUF929)
MANKERIRPNARARAAALREKERRREARRRMLLALGAVVAVLAVLGTLVAVKLAGGGSKDTALASTSLDPAVAAKATTVPAATLEAIGQGSVADTSLPKAVTGPALRKNGKPRVVYVGAEYCPYCAAERWPVVVALSRFGTWHNLGATTSGAKPEVYPKTPTFTFHGASYTSDYLAFEGVETETNKLVGSNYQPLDKITTEQQHLVDTYKPGGIPFIDFGNRFMISGASYNPGVLAGKSQAQIADDLTKPETAVGKAIGGAANAITAAVCTLTKNQPAKVCDSAAIKALQGKLGAG